MENSDTTISTNFFDNLWPLILNNNQCEIHSSNTSEFFMPQQKFDHIWAHELLASKRYDNYAPPIIFECKQSEQTKEIKDEEEIEQLPYREPTILPLDHQLEIVQQDVKIRQKLAYDFANRDFPWYIQRPSYLYEFKITDDLKSLFKEPFEYDILKNIQGSQCHLMIVDVAPSVPLRNLERWLKFSSYVVIVTVIHDRELYGKVKNFNGAFQAVLIEEHREGTWQEELSHSIDLGVEKANELFLLNEAGKAFVFVFSNNRGTCAWDKFKVLRKF